MKYKKIELENYNFHIIKTDVFKNIHLSINFRRNLDKNELTQRAVLINTLINSSKKYKNSKEIEIATEELYGLNVSFNSIKSGKCAILEINLKFLDEKYTEKNMFEKSIDFLYELLFNPNVTDGKFDDKSFHLAKEIVKDEIESIKDYPPSYSSKRLIEEIDSSNPASFDKNLIDLEKINSSNLYEYYKDILDNDVIDIYLAGNINKNMIELIIQKFNFRNRKKQILNHFSKINNNSKEIVSKEILPINQSVITVGYTFSNINNFERRYVLNLLNYILGGSSDSLLFNNVREKESLCYSISSSYSILSDLLTIKAGIDKKNYEKTKNLILNEIENIKNGKFNEDEINKGKICYENSIISMLDSLNSTLNLYKAINNVGADEINEKIKNIKKITKNDIIELANKMSLAKIFFLEGGLNEKN